MFKNAVQIFEIFGFKLRVDPSWLLIATLIVWSLSTSYFPEALPERSARFYTVLGIVAMLGMFASLILHELSHSLVARSHGLKVGGITLFIFGGVAELEEEPHDPKSEFLIAIAGPLMSLLLAVLFYGAASLLGADTEPSIVGAVCTYLALINLMLAVFNMIPAFPLDGGRMLRAVIWRVTRDLLRATRISSRIGSAFGLFLMLSGALAVFSGGGIGGFWQILIGFFIINASNGSYQNLLVKAALRGKSARSVMSEQVHTVDAGTSIASLVDDVMLRYGVSFVPVLSGETLLGYADTASVRSIDRQEWAVRPVSDIVVRVGRDTIVAPDTSLNEVFKRMALNSRRKLLVIEDGYLVGVISLSDLMHHLSLEQEVGAPFDFRD